MEGRFWMSLGDFEEGACGGCGVTLKGEFGRGI
jgi:hypothetical protein